MKEITEYLYILCILTYGNHLHIKIRFLHTAVVMYNPRQLQNNWLFKLYANTLYL